MFSSNFQYHITLLGEPQVGKTCILNQLVRKAFFTKYKPTLETDMEYIHEYNGRTYMCLIVDTAGHREFPAMRRLSITRASGFLVVFDLTNNESLEKAKQTCEEIKAHKVKQYINIILVGNKRDLVNQHNSSKDNNFDNNPVNPTEEATTFAEQLNEDPYIQCRYTNVSALETEEVRKLYEQLLDMLDTIHLTKASRHLANAFQTRNIRAKRNNNSGGIFNGSIMQKNQTTSRKSIPPSPTTNLIKRTFSRSARNLLSLSHENELNFSERNTDNTAIRDQVSRKNNFKRHSLPMETFHQLNPHPQVNEKRRSLPFWKSTSPRGLLRMKKSNSLHLK